MKNANTTGQKVSYEEPIGWRGELQVCAVRSRERIYGIPGICYLSMAFFSEQVKFKREKEGTLERPLSSPLLMKHYGVNLGLGF